MGNAISGKSGGIVAQFLQHRIPVHFGGMSDPLQPIERRVRVTEAILRGLLPHRYPVVISTRAPLIAESPYWELARDLGAVVQVSFSSAIDAVAARVEPFAPKPSALLKVMEFLSSKGIPVTCRWQPFIPGLSEPPENFVRTISATGCRHVALEHLKVPLEKDKEMLVSISSATGRDLRSEYRRLGALQDGRELVLPPNEKLSLVLETRKLVRQAGLTFGAADNEFQYLSDTPCCCSGVDQFPGFEQFFRHQIGYALYKSRALEEIVFSSISQEWAPTGSIDRYLNSKSRISGRRGATGTLSEHVLKRWNSPSDPGNPSSFARVTFSGKFDETGNRVYKWRKPTD